MADNPDDVEQAVTNHRALSTADKKEALQSLKQSGDVGGLFQLNSGTRAIVCIGMMLIFILIVWKVTDLIGASFAVNISTVTGTGDMATTGSKPPPILIWQLPGRSSPLWWRGLSAYSCPARSRHRQRPVARAASSTAAASGSGTGFRSAAQ